MMRHVRSYWLVVLTILKNISQLGVLFPIYGKMKNVPNHQPGSHFDPQTTTEQQPFCACERLVSTAIKSEEASQPGRRAELPTGYLPVNQQRHGISIMCHVVNPNDKPSAESRESWVGFVHWGTMACPSAIIGNQPTPERWTDQEWLLVGGFSPPLWKIWVRQLGLLFPIYGKIIHSCSKPPIRLGLCVGVYQPAVILRRANHHVFSMISRHFISIFVAEKIPCLAG